MTMLSVPMPPGAPAPDEHVCWKQDSRPDAIDPMSHCTFMKHHVGFCTWRRCADEREFIEDGRDVVRRCQLERGHGERGHEYARIYWAPGYPTVRR